MTGLRSAAYLVLAALVAAGAPARAAGTNGDAAGIAYRVDYVGLPDGAFGETLRGLGRLEPGMSDPPATRASLARRAARDAEAIETALRAEAFYAAAVVTRVRDTPDGAVVDVAVETGPRFLIETVRFETGGDAAAAQVLAGTGLETQLNGRPAAGATIVSAERALHAALRNAGFAFAEIGPREVVADFADGSADIVLRYAPGPRVTIGAVTVSGAPNVNTPFLRRVAGLETGAQWQAAELDAAEGRLRDTGLFQSVRIRTEAPGPDGAADLTIEAAERAPRTIGAGARWASDEGFGGLVFWRHRNLFGGGEAFEVNLGAAELARTLSLSLAKPAFLVADQTLIFAARAAEEETDAYDQLQLAGSVALTRRLSKRWTAGAGARVAWQSIDEGTGEETSLIVSLPLTASYDGSDDLLNPQSGERLSLTFEPAGGTADGEGLFYLHAEARASIYWTPDFARGATFAARARAGSLIGAGTSEIPISYRLFAGGGGSIRGYAFQTAGPLDAGGDPAGGASVLEVAAELRFPVWGDIGGVAFIDAGRAFRSEVPKLSDGLLTAAGIGVRYATPIGPIRADIAVPLNPRDGDAGVQIYLSLGQAF